MATAKKTPAKSKAKAPSFLTADALIAKLARPEPVAVEVPGMGWIKVQKLTVGEHDEILDLCTIRDAQGNAIANPYGGVQVDPDKRALLTLIAQVAEPELTPEALGKFDDLGVDAYSLLRAAIASTHGMSAEEAEARFPA